MHEPAKRILVLHPGALGDVLQAVPALRVLGRRGAVTLAAQGRVATLLRDTGVVAEARSFDTLGLEALFTPDLPAPASIREFTRVVSWFGATDATFESRLREAAPCSVIASPTGPAGAARPVWRHLLDTVAALVVAPERIGGDAPLTAPVDAPATRQPPPPSDVAPLVLPAEWRARARAALSAIGIDIRRQVVVVHPGAGGAWKRWPAASFASVIERLARLDVQPVVHQGPADRDAAAELGGLLGGRTRELVEPDLPLLAAVLGEASGYLGGDSGVSHLAAAVGAAAVILYPPETLDRWAPWSPTALAVAADEVADGRDEVARRLVERMRLGDGRGST